MSYCSISVSVSNEQSCLEVEFGVQVQTKANSIELWLKADFLRRAPVFDCDTSREMKLPVWTSKFKMSKNRFYRPFANLSRTEK